MYQEFLCYFYMMIFVLYCFLLFFFFQAEDGIRDFCLSRGLGDVYKRQLLNLVKSVMYLLAYIYTTVSPVGIGKITDVGVSVIQNAPVVLSCE